MPPKGSRKANLPSDSQSKGQTDSPAPQSRVGDAGHEPDFTLPSIQDPPSLTLSAILDFLRTLTPRFTSLPSVLMDAEWAALRILIQKGAAEGILLMICGRGVPSEADLEFHSVKGDYESVSPPGYISPYVHAETQLVQARLTAMGRKWAKALQLENSQDPVKMRTTVLRLLRRAPTKPGHWRLVSSPNDSLTPLQKAIEGLVHALEKHRLTFLYCAFPKRRNPANPGSIWETLERDELPQNHTRHDATDMTNEDDFLFLHRHVLEQFAQDAIGQFGPGKGCKPQIGTADGKWVDVEGGAYPHWSLDELDCQIMEDSSDELRDACKAVVAADTSGVGASLVKQAMSVVHDSGQPRWYSAIVVRWEYLSNLDQAITAIKNARVTIPNRRTNDPPAGSSSAEQTLPASGKEQSRSRAPTGGGNADDRRSQASDTFYLLAESRPFYAVSSKEVAESLAGLFRQGQPPDQPSVAIEVGAGASMDLAQRVLYRQSIDLLERMALCDGDPGIRKDAGLPNDKRTVLLWEYHERARQWEPLVRNELDVAHGKAKDFYLWWTWWTVYPQEPTANLNERFYFYRVATENVAARLCEAFGRCHGIDIRFGYTASEALDIDETARANTSIEKYRRGEYTGKDAVAHLFTDARQWEHALPTYLGSDPLPQEAADDERCAATHKGPDGSPDIPRKSEPVSPKGTRVAPPVRDELRVDPSDTDAEAATGGKPGDGAAARGPDTAHSASSQQPMSESERRKAMVEGGLADAVVIAFELRDLHLMEYRYPSNVDPAEIKAIREGLTAAFEWILAKPGFEEFKNAHEGPQLADLAPDAKFSVMAGMLVHWHPDFPKSATTEAAVRDATKVLAKCQEQASRDVQRTVARIQEIQFTDCRIPHPAGDPTFRETRRFLQLLREYWGLGRQVVLDMSEAMCGFQPHPLLPLMMNLRLRLEACFGELASEEGAQDAQGAANTLLDTALGSEPDDLSVVPEWTNGEIAKVEAFVERTRLRLGSKTYPLTREEGMFIQVAQEAITKHREEIEKAWATRLKNADRQRREREARGVAAGNPVKTTTEAQAPERTNEAGAARQVDPDERLSPAAIAKAIGLPWPHEALRKRLERFRKKNFDAFWQVDNRKPTEPEFLYRARTVLPLLEDLKASGKTSGKRPAQKNPR